jgi:hypothetical protein
MRMLITVRMPAAGGNKAIREGKIGPVMGAFAEKHKPSSMIFTTNDGLRTMYAVFDLTDNAHVPAIAEPFFMELEAQVDLQPAMDMADLQKGLAAIG